MTNVQILELVIKVGFLLGATMTILTVFLRIKNAFYDLVGNPKAKEPWAKWSLMYVAKRSTFPQRNGEPTVVLCRQTGFFKKKQQEQEFRLIWPPAGGSRWVQYPNGQYVSKTTEHRLTMDYHRYTVWCNEPKVDQVTDQPKGV